MVRRALAGIAAAMLAGIAAGAVLLAGVASAHETTAAAGPMVLGAHDLTRYLHVVLLVFWLGPDVAIMIAGRHAANPALNGAQRAGALRMMEYYELMPRVCMSLMLTVGGVLSEQMGVRHPGWQMAGIWLLGPVWLSLTLVAYFGGRAGAGALADRLDLGLRLALIAGIPVSVAWSTLTGRLAAAPYVGGKLIAFALILLAGLLGRRAFAPFRTGVRDLAAGSTAPGLEAGITASFRRGNRYVVATWVLLLLAAFMGVARFGAPDDESGHADAATLSTPEQSSD